MHNAVIAKAPPGVKSQDFSWGCLRHCGSDYNPVQTTTNAKELFKRELRSFPQKYCDFTLQA